jgi:ABC-type polysaccharide/polyol phosphate transport system ATPase subunit
MNAIEVKGVSKKYRLYHDYAPTLKEKILFRNRSAYEDLWVLKDIDLQIEPGQTVGLIGQNGSGKSTLLKLMSRIIYPDKGEIRMNGRVSSLLELGAGFHPDFTGLENIYMNAAIFGMARKEIDRRLDAILEFAELGDFINSPVRTYSSGMYMRLAFSVAINVEPDILLVDEILSVGDESFQKKCFAHMEGNKAAGVTTIIVSHDLTSIQRLCDKVVWLHGGRIVAAGYPVDIINEYRTAVAQHDNERISAEIKKQHQKEEIDIPHDNTSIESCSPQSERWGNRSVIIEKVYLLNQHGEERYTFKCGEPCIIEMKARTQQSVDDLVFGIGIFRQDNICCYGTNTYIDNYQVNSVCAGQEVTVRCIIDRINLIPGEYFLDIAAHDHYGTPYDYQTRQTRISIYSDKQDIGICRLDHKWEVF